MVNNRRIHTWWFLWEGVEVVQVKGRDAYYKRLAKRWEKRHRHFQKKLLRKHGEALQWVTQHVGSSQLAAGSLGGLLLLSSPSSPALPPPSHLLAATSEFAQTLPGETFLVSDLAKMLPNEVRPLTIEEEQTATEVLTRSFGFRVVAELEGKRLDRSYGIIGQEQHLARYPGDSMATHFDTAEEAVQFTQEGMARGLSGWGYFTSSRNGMTEQDARREKYYIAVQTFVAQDYYQRSLEYNTFFKYRKMLVVNPQNGKAIVVVVGDVGPATWTGKHLGGSPEVMAHLERVDGPRKGPVLFFFIDDPEDRIPLGPIEAYTNVG